MRFLSPEWADAVTTTIARDADVLPALPDREHVLRLDVDGAGPLTLRVGGSVTLSAGDGGPPDATLRYSYDTAARMARRELMPGEAFRAGLVRLDGPPEALADLEEVFDDVIWAMSAVDCEY